MYSETIKYTEMAATMKYTLQDFNDIIFNGFNLVLPDDTVEIISKLAKEVGSPDYVKTPVFKKKDNQPFKKKRVAEPTKSFQTTHIEEKVGADAQIDTIRSNLNKMTDKNYIDIRNKIFDVIDEITGNDDDMIRVSTVIFEIASNNRFFSKMYAELYADLLNKYDMMKGVFENSLNQFTQLFSQIEYVDPNVDYDKFCKINKDNERRKALSAFFMNFMDNNIITKERIVEITRNLLAQMYTFISTENKKNEVDELTENIALLYREELYATTPHEPIDGMNIGQLIDKIARSKTKDYKSLTNKALFKFMDLVHI